MAGDWIPIDTTLPGKPEVARMSALLGKSVDECIGMLIRFWIWCQAHTADGCLSGMDTAMIAAVSHVPERFLGALQQVGWLEVTESGCSVPNFERWLSGGAKRRLQDAQRKREKRLSAKCPQSVRKMSASKADKMRTKGEKSKSKELACASSPPRSPPNKAAVDWTSVSFPDGCDTPDVRNAIIEWLEYRRKIGKPYRQAERQISLLLADYGNSIPEAVRHSIAQGYQGCFLPTKPKGGANGKPIRRSERHPEDVRDRWAT